MTVSLPESAMATQKEHAGFGSGEEEEQRAKPPHGHRLSQPVQALLAYYERQKIAGKLNLVLLFLWSLVLANSVFVFAALYVAYGNAQSIAKLNSFEKQVDEIRLAQSRFRVSHERADALTARDLLDQARETLSRLPADVLNAPEVVGPGGESTDVLMAAFDSRSHEYLFYNEQTRALERAMQKASDDLLTNLQALQARVAMERASLAPALSSLAQSVLGARLLEKEYFVRNGHRPGPRMEQLVDAIVTEAAQVRRLAANVEIQVAAYKIGQQARSLAGAYGKVRDYAMRSEANEQRMNQAAQAISERITKASKRQGDAIDRQLILIIASIVAASLLMVVLGTLLGRRFVRDITSPLTQLAQVSGEIARGDYDARIRVEAQDEIGELADRFNEMARTVRRHVETLHNSEQQVRQRTEELEVANRLLAVAKETAEAHNETLEARVLERTAALEDANRKLSELTVTDALTGLANRRRFDAVFADEWSRGCRSRQPLAVIMLDIDYFKPYNDHYGHQAGDECLRAVARVLQTSARRAGDLVARYGGEEFVVVAADADLGTARELAETMRRAVELLAMPHAVSQAAEVVTISLGIAVVVPSEHMQAARLLHQADDALYRAKNEGRNRLST